MTRQLSVLCISTKCSERIINSIEILAQYIMFEQFAAAVGDWAINKEVTEGPVHISFEESVAAEYVNKYPRLRASRLCFRHT